MEGRKEGWKGEKEVEREVIKTEEQKWNQKNLKFERVSNKNGASEKIKLDCTRRLFKEDGGCQGCGNERANVWLWLGSGYWIRGKQRRDERTEERYGRKGPWRSSRGSIAVRIGKGDLSPYFDIHYPFRVHRQPFSLSSQEKFHSSLLPPSTRMRMCAGAIGGLFDWSILERAPVRATYDK